MSTNYAFLEAAYELGEAGVEYRSQFRKNQISKDEAHKLWKDAIKKFWDKPCVIYYTGKFPNSVQVDEENFLVHLTLM